MNTKQLIRTEGDELYVGESRISLRTLVTAHARGESSEAIHENFPSLSLAQIDGALTYYRERQSALDAHFAEQQHLLDELDAANRAAQAPFIDTMRQRFEHARDQRQATPETADQARGA